MTNWKKVSEAYVYRGWRRVLKKRFRLPDGKEADFDVIGNNPFVTVAAFTQDMDAILVRQFRPGPEIPLISFSEGYIEAAESPADAARRELLEETGYEAGQITFLKEMRSAYSTEHRICLLATDCIKTNEQNLDQTEFIEVLTMSLPEFRSFLQDNQRHDFTNVDCAYLALDHLGILGKLKTNLS